MVAAVFLVHPVQTEAVACVSGISNLACAFFMLMSLYGYVRSAQGIGSSRISWMVVAVCVFMIALLTKEQAVVLPAICLIYEVLIRERRRVGSLLLRVGLMVLPLLGYLFLRQMLFGSFVSSVFENIAELKLRVLAIAGLLEMYGGLLLFSSGLHYYRSIDILAPYVSSWIILGMIILLVYLCLRPLTGLNKRISFFGLAWFLLALGPVLNIIPLVNEYSFIAAAEHNLYFPMIGFLVSAGAVTNYYAPVFNDFLKTWARIIFIIGIICLAFLTIAQNRYWQGEIPLFQRALAFEPQLGRVHILLAKAYFKEGRMDQAIQEFSTARDIMIGYVHKCTTPKAKKFYQGMLKGIYSDSAQAYASKRDLKASIENYNLALEIDPQDSYIYTNRALSLIAVGDLKGGMADLQKALALNPDNLLAANNLSICFIQQGDISGARGLLESILIKDPGFTAARDNLDKLNKAQKAGP
jgi:tetratricopeptide (TPR) repeat protein